MLAITGKFLFYSFWQAMYLLKIFSLLERHEHGFQELEYLAELCYLARAQKKKAT